jgi:hypothetical protein
MSEDLSRRRFLRDTAAVAAAVAMTKVARADDPRAKVVVVTCPKAIDDKDNADPAAVRTMLEKGICALAGKDQPADAWKSFVQPSDKVCLVDSGTWLLNVPSVPAEVARGLKSAGPAGFTFAVCASAAKNTAYVAALKAAMAAAGVPENVVRTDLYLQPGKVSEQGFTLISTTPTLKKHLICGVSGVIKHYATFSQTHVKNHHPNAMATCGQPLGDEFKSYKHLTVVDALRWGDGRKGPAYYQKSLLLSTDPVAADVIALKLYLQNMEAFPGLPPELHRNNADKLYHAGIADLARIDVTKVDL